MVRWIFPAFFIAFLFTPQSASFSVHSKGKNGIFEKNLKSLEANQPLACVVGWNDHSVSETLMLEDKILILRFKHGSRPAFRRIYEKYKRYLLKLASALLQDTSNAEDIVHDVFIRLAQSAGRIRPEGNLKSYLRTCLLNSIRNKARTEKLRSARNIDSMEPAAADCNSPDRWVILTEQAKKIRDALARLPYEQREVIILHLHGDMKLKEIADYQDVPIKTVQSRYRYGLDKLKGLLQSETIP